MSNDYGRPDVTEAANRMNRKMGAKGELFKLPDLLSGDETVQRIVAGLYGGGTGIFVLTDARLVFLRHTRKKEIVEEFPLDTLASIQWNSGIMNGKIMISASGNKFEVTNVDQTDGKVFAESVQGYLSSLSKPDRPPPPPTGPPTDTAPANPEVPNPPDGVAALKQLQELKQMLDATLITQGEFDDKKADILSRM